VSNARVFYSLTQEQGQIPDGSIVNSKGEVWNCQWNGSRVQLISPEGKLLQTIKLPVSNVTCAALGGPDLDILLITTACKEGEPESGGIFMARVETKGLPENKLKN